VAEIETQTVRGDQGAFLSDVIPQDAVQRFMKQVSGGVVLHNECSAFRVNGCAQTLPSPNRAA
jgi:hypothetical protein